jgi:hypothetical protein
MNEQKYDPPDEPHHSPPPPPPPGPPPGYAAPNQPIYLSINQPAPAPSAPRSTVVNVKPPIPYYTGMKSPQLWLADFNNYVQLTEMPGYKWAPLLASQVADPDCKAALMESEKLPYEDDYMHFARGRMAQLFLDWFQTTAIESDHAISRLSRVKKQIDEPLDAFVSRYEQCAAKAHPIGDIAERTKIRLLIEGLEGDIIRAWYGAAVQYQGQGYKKTVAFIGTLYVNRDPFLTQRYMFEYIKEDRLKHRSAGPSNAGSLVDIATRTHAPSVAGLVRPTDYHHSALVALDCNLFLRI